MKINSSLIEGALEFRCDVENKNYVEFGSGSRMATFKLWKGSELIKIQVNFIERLIFPHRNVIAETLLAGKEISDDERAYFEEFLEFYSPVKLVAYSPEEILCENIRAILTRKAMKLRDIYDVFIIEKSGVRMDELKEKVVEKITAAMRFRKYRKAIRTGMDRFDLEIALSDLYELDMFVIKPGEEFYFFANQLKEFLNDIIQEFQGV